MRTLRRWVSVGLPVLGLIVVFAAIVGVAERQTQIVFVLVGVLLIEAGVWKLANPLLPSERRYTELRGEVDHFIHQIRDLNDAALEAREASEPVAWARYQEIVDRLHDSVDRMAQLAGKEVGDPETELPQETARAAAAEARAYAERMTSDLP